MQRLIALATLLANLLAAGIGCAAGTVKPVYFDEPESAQFFAQSNAKANYWALSRFYETQRIDTFCSVTSSTMVLNALGIKPAIQQAMIYPYNVFNHENFFTPQVLALQAVRNIAGDGLTLGELADVLATFGVSVARLDADHATVAEFRRRAQSALGSTDHYVIVNFLRSRIGQDGGGHFSPLGAYDAKSDRFLVLDTARYKYPPFWVKAGDLWEAMNTVDASAKMKRGFLIVGRPPR
jgi:hypothetical protein